MGSSNFWQYIGHNETSDNGFGLFTKAHFTWLLVLAVLIAAFVFFYYKGSERRRDNMRKCTALFLICIEIFKQCVDSLNGLPAGVYLPLEICSFAEYAIMIDALWPRLGVTKQLLAFAFLPAAFIALVMPSATMYPAISFYAMHQLIMHAGIMAYGLARFRAGEIHPVYKGVWISVLIIGGIMIPVYRLNVMFDQNYMFTADPDNNIILRAIWNLSGAKGGLPYVISLTIMVTIVMHITYGLYRLIGLRGKKKVD